MTAVVSDILLLAVRDCLDRTLSHPSPVRGVSMMNRKWLALAMGLAALVAVGGFVATGMMPALAEEQSAKDKEQSAKDKEQSAEDKEHPAKKRRADFIA